MPPVGFLICEVAICFSSLLLYRVSLAFCVVLVNVVGGLLL